MESPSLTQKNLSRAAAKKQKNDEYDMLTSDQIICIPSKRNADGSIDIIMSNREGKVFCCTEADDRIAWEATSHSVPGG